MPQSGSYIRLAASSIASQWYSRDVRALFAHLASDIACRQFGANIISLKPLVSISLSRSENITLCEAQNITNVGLSMMCYKIRRVRR